MKLRDTVILVVLAHIGLVLIWICMGGCANDKSQETQEKVAVVGPEASEMEMPPVARDVPSEGSLPVILPEPTPITPGVASPAPSALTPAPGLTRPTEPSGEEITITLKPGDTLWALGRKYHVPVSVIEDRNDIQNANMIRAGRELIIPLGPGAVETPEPVAESPTESIGEASTALPEGAEAVPVADDTETALHKVVSGETIWILARRYGTTSTKIMDENNITDPTKLQIGQELRIPKGE